MLCERHGMLVGWNTTLLLSTGGCLLLLLLALALQRQWPTSRGANETLRPIGALWSPSGPLQCLGQHQAARGEGEGKQQRLLAAL